MNKIWAVNKLDNQTAEILLYGYIGGDKVNAADFVAELKQLESKYTTIKLRINSGGGSIFEGFAIFNAIKQSSCKIDAYIDGLAASMASVIVLACDKIYMSKVAMLMTHRPSGAAMGNPDQLRSTADMLEQLEETVCTIYKDRTGLSMDEVKSKYMGTSDNWLSAQDALEAKLIDGVYDSPKPASLPPANMRQEKDLVNYFTNSFNHLNMKQFTLSANLMATLGLTADSDNSAAESVIATMAAKAQKVDQLTTELSTAKETIQTFESNAVNAKAEKLVDDAIVARKIVAGDREKYLRLAKADFEGTESIVNDLKPYMSISEQITSGDSNAVELAELVKMSGRDLHMQGKFERLKQLNLSEFKNKYKEYFGQDYK
jgi:ATP-dependent protease ClpP protease subunit